MLHNRKPYMLRPIGRLAMERNRIMHGCRDAGGFKSFDDLGTVFDEYGVLGVDGCSVGANRRYLAGIGWRRAVGSYQVCVAGA
jgi:hypothetical protein